MDVDVRIIHNVLEDSIAFCAQVALYKCICCMMKPYIKDGKCAISSPMHTSVCKSPPLCALVQ